MKKLLLILGMVVFSTVAYAQYQPMGDAERHLRETNTLSSRLLYELHKNFFNDKVSDDEVAKIAEEEFNKAFKEILKRIDKFSAYHPPVEAKEVMENFTGNYVGIGARVDQSEEGYVKIVIPMEGSPALNAGLQMNDLIYQIDDYVVSKDDDFKKVIDRIKGPNGSVVKLHIYRDEGNVRVSKVIPVTRGEIHIMEIKAKVIEGDIAYVRMSSFSDTAAIDFVNAINEINVLNKKGLILDLRFNPGGSLVETVKILDLFIPRGQVLTTTKSKKNGNRSFIAQFDPYFPPNYPVAVLINGQSASASELSTSALQDHKIAFVIGEKSFGKGSVQTISQLPNKGLLRITTNIYYRPNGDTVNDKGVMPDMIIDVSDEEKKELVKSLYLNTPVSDKELTAAIDLIRVCEGKTRRECY